MPPERTKVNLGAVSAVGMPPLPSHDEPKARRRRSLMTTAALASVLLALGAFTMQGNVQTSRATDAQSQALALDTLFSEARHAVALQEVHVRHYQVEPAVAVRTRFATEASMVTNALRRASRANNGQAKADAARLLAEQEAYRNIADRLFDAIADRDPSVPQLDRLQATPAFYTLQQDIDTVARSYHATAERQAAQLRDAQQRMLIGTGAGFTLGLGLLGMIWRLVLGYQRRLAEHADASQHLAMHDALTGLPNRTLFDQKLRSALDAARHAPDRQVALLIVDLNEFKNVNDTLGHQAGDELLVSVAQRLRDTAREFDIVARFGGDEFAVLLPDIPNLSAAEAVAKRMAYALRQDFRLSAGPAAVSGSIGLAIGPVAGEAEELVRHADAAMYRAKSSGRSVVVFHAESEIEAPNRLGLFGELRALLDSGDQDSQLVLHFQPQVRIADGAVTGVEALVRWEHPQRGLLLPDAFLPAAETGGLEIPLTYHLLDSAVGAAARWHRADHPLVVSVNVSPRCLLDDEFVPNVIAAVKRVDLPPRLLKLELTEHTLMAEPELAVSALRQIHDFGVLVSVDDFGSGFSSLSQLKRLPADELKIDRGFIRDLATDPDDSVLVRSAIELAHNLGLSVVAEGVEDLGALRILRDLGSDYAQGHALSAPVGAKALFAACAQAEQLARSVLAVGHPESLQRRAL
jgi:diguanylate cyclase (GGDEF)-like protein